VSDEDRSLLAAISAQMTMVLKVLDELRECNLRCRDHCDSAMSGVFRRMVDVEKSLHTIQAVKINPHWMVAAAEWLGIAVLIYLGLHK
jgi:hypothetical protein